jgi:hypothetical protein
MQRTNEEGAVTVEVDTEKPVKKRGRGRPPVTPEESKELQTVQALKDARQRKSHPDPILSKTVATMALAGFPREQICAALKISPETLGQHYHDEMTHGRTNIMAEVVGSLAQRAIAGSDTAAIWLTKTRLGWSDRQQVDVNANIEVVHHRGELMSELTGLIQKGITIDAEPIPENPGKTDSDP